MIGEQNMIPNLTPEDYQFTVDVQGRKYDVYRFVKDGVVGQLAFTNGAKGFEIALLRKGTKTADEVQAEILAALQKSAN